MTYLTSITFFMGGMKFNARSLGENGAVISATAIEDLGCYNLETVRRFGPSEFNTAEQAFLSIREWTHSCCTEWLNETDRQYIERVFTALKSL